MKAAFVILAACTVASTALVRSEPKISDATLVAAILGTWEQLAPDDPQKTIGESTYTKDGFVRGFAVMSAKSSDGSTKDIKITMKAQWRIENGAIYLNRFETIPSELLPVDHAQQYEIVSISSDEMVFRDPKDGEELRRRRKKG